MVERELKRGVRRLVAQEYEVNTLAGFGWRELFIDLVRDGRWIGAASTDSEVRERSRRRWEQAGQAYIGNDKYPSGFPLRPQLSPITRRTVDWLRTYRLDASGKEIPEITCPVNKASQQASLRLTK